MEPVNVVIRYVNSKIIKGYTNDFFPNKTQLHVRPIESQPTDKGIEIHLMELKAVFFVKDFTGNPKYNDKKQFPEGQQFSGQ